MLQKLSIQNFAIIDRLDLEFESGLNILSGETGAGKSIIIQAVSLLLGSRGYSDLIRSGESECEVMATFDIEKSPSVRRLLSQLGYPDHSPLVIRRILARSGKGKIFIDDQTATVATLHEIGNRLIDLVSQHESQNLLNPSMPLIYLDEWGGHGSSLHRYRQVYEEYQNILFQIKSLGEKARLAQEKEDLIRFQLKEIEEVNPKPEEEEQLLKDKKILANASKIHEAVSQAESFLYSASGSVTELLGQATHALARIAQIDPEIDHPAKSLESHALEIEEIARFFNSYLKKIDFDSGSLTQIENRLDILSSLKRKHGGSVTSILEKRSHLQEQLRLLDDFEDASGEWNRRREETENKLAQEGLQLRKLRQKAAEKLAREIEKELATLSMPQCRFEVRMSAKKSEEDLEGGKIHFSPTGMDDIEFLIAPNVGEELKPLGLIASGGELARILLAIKTLVRRPESAFTFIFDEVDTGIGGGVAEGVGRKLQKISRSAQVLCITHLPQIAACADSHYQIFNAQKKQRTLTSVRRLDLHEREEEIARMLAGMTITDKARQHAKELIRQLKEVEG